MGEERGTRCVVRTADAVIAVAGEFGTLSEIALALKMGKPVVGLGTWELSKGGAPVEAIVRSNLPPTPSRRRSAVELRWPGAEAASGPVALRHDEVSHAERDQQPMKHASPSRMPASTHVGT